MPITAPIRFVAVVVAYNREELLRECLDALAAQTVPLAGLVVVDNASADASFDVASSHPVGADVLRLTRNAGGAGGFAVGMARAFEAHRPDWIWILDDDTIPTETALAELDAVVRADSGRPELALVASRVVWTTGQDHPMNTPRRKPFLGKRERAAAAALGVLPVRSASFVSSLVRADAVRRSGMPIAEYFLWNDDFEFSAKLLRRRRGVFAPGSVVLHKTRLLGSTDNDPGERFYLEVRNKVWLFRRSRALAGWEKPIYVGASLLRWGRTFRRSSDRKLLRDCLRRGLRDGFRSSPRPNATVLADAGVPAALLARVDAMPAKRGRE
ncbi:glycosyltransferase [Lysobacter korlensis]|uniref:Glycosyltransferase n=1 Tax=Lysobacter korlensis TaxID=553636 RepID=A0ABV6RZN0_9GAMM